jgi:hypothetical protein
MLGSNQKVQLELGLSTKILTCGSDLESGVGQSASRIVCFDSVTRVKT